MELLHIIKNRCRDTANSRFEASRRMKRCYNASTLCIAMLSFEIIVLNLLVFIPALRLDSVSITVTTVCLSVFVLVLSLILSQLQYDKKASKFHKCANALKNLENSIDIRISSGESPSIEEIKEFNKDYADIIKTSNLNHSSVDYDWAKIKEAKKRGDLPFNAYQWRKWNWTYIKWHFLLSDSIYNLLTILGACAIVVIAICCKEPG